MSTRTGFILINPDGHYAYPVKSGGNFAIDPKYTVAYRGTLQEAYLFTDAERRTDAVILAKKQGCVEVAAYEQCIIKIYAGVTK